MKVFISWSGETSRQVALALRDWLPMVIQSVGPCVSSEDIDKGARWSSDISKELEDSQYGILCITAQNLDAPWVNFEAGALSKALQQSRVAPFLYQVDRTDVKGPLLQFQSTVFDKEDVRKLVKSINRACEKASLDEARLDEIFEVLWPNLNQRLAALAAGASAHSLQPQRSLEDLASEILELVRGQQKLLSNPEQLLPPDYVDLVLKMSTASRALDIPPGAIIDLDARWRHLFVFVETERADRIDSSEFKHLVLGLADPMDYILSRLKATIPDFVEQRRSPIRTVKQDAKRTDRSTTDS